MTRRMAVGDLFRKAKEAGVVLALCSSDGVTQLGLMYYTDNNRIPDIKAWACPNNQGGVYVEPLTPKGWEFVGFPIG